mmetsp:Transcript_17252/g.19826  ORF Transcript_17252/g.19826 Transcript_17252/m.19826 type:complete len:252 (-) Transcript_17252:438-1193(-)
MGSRRLHCLALINLILGKFPTPHGHMHQPVTLHIKLLKPFDTITEVALPRLLEFSCRDITNMLWAYAVSNFPSNVEFGCNSTVVNIVISRFDNFDNKHLGQLHQWNLWCRERLGRNMLPLDLSDHCLKSFIQNKNVTSELQRDVARVLVEMGLAVKEEALLETGYTVDLLVSMHDKKIAVEVNGPSHYFGRSRTKTGSTLLKYRQISALDGLTIVSVPYWEWDKISAKGKNERKKHEIIYLKNLLEREDRN